MKVYLNEIQADLIIAKQNLVPLDGFFVVLQKFRSWTKFLLSHLVLLQFEDKLVKKLLQFFICIIDAQLFKTVNLEGYFHTIGY